MHDVGIRARRHEFKFHYQNKPSHVRVSIMKKYQGLHVMRIVENIIE